MSIVKATITGITPMLTNKFTGEDAESASRGTSTATRAGKTLTRKEQAEKKLYLNAKGNPCMPAPNLFRMIIDAGKFFKDGKSTLTTTKTSRIPGCVYILGTDFEIKCSQGWQVDTQPVRNPATGGRFLCHRPRFDDWSITFDMEVVDELMSSDFVREILETAGKRIGMGDFRPLCRGSYGIFRVDRWEVVDNKKSVLFSS